VLALVGDPDAEVYEILFSFSSPAGKRNFLDLVRTQTKTWVLRMLKKFVCASGV
jgi:hypothetical protein